MNNFFILSILSLVINRSNAENISNAILHKNHTDITNATICYCDNGVAANGTACTTNGTNICSSCSDGYHKTTNDTCTQNVCSCTNGVAANGTACTTNGTNICSSCSGGYYKTTNNTCTGCTTCGTGFTETTACFSASNRVCTQNVCSCANGVAANGTACTANGTNICSSCSGGYHQTTNNTCTQNVCSCTNGVAANGTACTANGTNICSSCSGGYHQTTNNTCTQNVCSCTNGVAANGTACTANGTNICSSCSGGYYKTDDTCTGCTTCGTGKRQTTACSSLSNRVCTQNDCSCSNGVAATGTACTDNGTNICSSCYDEYYKTTNNTCAIFNCNTDGMKATRRCRCGNVTCSSDQYCINSSINSTFCSAHDPSLVYNSDYNFSSYNYFPDCAQGGKDCQCWKSTTGTTDGAKSQCTTSQTCFTAYGNCLEHDYCTSRNGALRNSAKCTCELLNSASTVVCDEDKFCVAANSTCKDSSITRCDNRLGEESNKDSMSDGQCVCGPTSVCGQSNSYCLADSNACASSPLTACAPDEINQEECKCGSGQIETCLIGQKCTVLSDGQGVCNYPLCSDKISCDSNPTNNIYYNGVNGNRCTTADCGEPADYDRCCNRCADGDWDPVHNECSQTCDNKNWRCNSSQYAEPPDGYRLTMETRYEFPVWERKRLEFPFTDRCNGNCSKTQINLQSCCLPKDSCDSARHQQIWDPKEGIVVPLCRAKYGYVSDPTRDGQECSGVLCTPEECCVEKKCTCANGVKALPPACTQNNQSMCQSCHPQFWKNGTTCVAGSTCNNYQYQKEAANGVDDTKCHNLTICTEATEYQLTSETNTSDRICAALSECDLDTQYISKNKTITSDRTCTDKTVCNYTSQWESQTASKFNDRVCTNILAECDYPTHYEFQSPTKYQNRICKQVAPSCNSSFYESQSPSATQDRICTAITDCSSTQYETANYTNSTNRQCAYLSNCSNTTEYESQNYNATSDRICTHLTICAYSEYQSTTNTATSDRQCSPLSTCNETQYAEEPSFFNQIGIKMYDSDRICQTCNYTGCVGCRKTSDCKYNNVSKVHSDASCSGNTCTFYSYNNLSFANSDGIRVGDIVLKIGNWVRFDQNGTEPMTLNNVQDGVELDVYQYFQVPDVEKVSYSVSATNSSFKVEQDCKYDYVYNESCIGTFDNHKCSNGNSRSGTKKHWIHVTVEPSDGGDACPDNPFNTPCVNYECDRDCMFTSGEWSTCQDKQGNAVACGGDGHELLDYYISQEANYDGVSCPVGNDYALIIAHDSATLAKDDKIQLSNMEFTVVKHRHNETIVSSPGIQQILTNSLVDIACSDNCTTFRVDTTLIPIKSVTIRLTKSRPCVQDKPHNCYDYKSNRLAESACLGSNNRWVQDCDCHGHIFDSCGVCGGTCCPKGTKKDKCGICDGNGDCALRLARQHAHREDKHVRSRTMRLFAPTFTFVLLTIAFTGFCICICKEKSAP